MSDIKEALKKIKEKGYYKIEIRPVDFTKELLNKKTVKTLLEETQSNLRGWYFPHIPRKFDGAESTSTFDEGYQGWCLFGHFPEAWRLYQSAYFIDFKSMEEDWIEKSSIAPDSIKSSYQGKTLDAITLIWDITEFFYFFKRFVEKVQNSSEFLIRITLNDILDRKLVIVGGNRAPFHTDYICRHDGNYTWEKTLSTDSIRLDYIEHSKEVILELYALFGWDSVNTEIIDQEQQKLLSRGL